MKIAGLQKLTLLDYPGKCACTVFTDGCNFRCPFCHNADLVDPQKESSEIAEDQIMAFLEKRKKVLDAVAITGGEPLLHKDIGGFIEKVKSLGYAVKLDTNGSFPELLKELVRNGLVDRVAMDIKNSPKLYPVTTGLERPDMAKIEESKDFLLQGTVDYEFRTTVVKGLHTEESLIDAAKWISGAREYYLQQFKDSGNVLRIEGLGEYNSEEMRSLADAVRKYVPCVSVRGI